MPLGLFDSQCLCAAAWQHAVGASELCCRSRSLGSKAAALPVIVWIYGGSNVMGDVAFYGPIEHLCSNQVPETSYTAVFGRII